MNAREMAKQLTAHLADCGVLLEDDAAMDEYDGIYAQTERYIEEFLRPALGQSRMSGLLDAAREAQELNKPIRNK